MIWVPHFCSVIAVWMAWGRAEAMGSVGMSADDSARMLSIGARQYRERAGRQYHGMKIIVDWLHVAGPWFFPQHYNGGSREFFIDERMIRVPQFFPIVAVSVAWERAGAMGSAGMSADDSARGLSISVVPVVVRQLFLPIPNLLPIGWCPKSWRSRSRNCWLHIFSLSVSSQALRSVKQSPPEPIHAPV